LVQLQALFFDIQQLSSLTKLEVTKKIKLGQP